MFSLSPSQEIVWLHEQLLPGSRSYNFTAVLDLRGTLDVGALKAALTQVMAHHPGLRLELVPQVGSPPGQRVREGAEPRLRTSDLSGEADPEEAFQRLLRQEAEEPIDTEQAPMLRWHLVGMGERFHRLVQVEHHLTHDGKSFAILLHDLFTAYAAQLRGLSHEPAPTRSYEEFVRTASDTGDDAERSSLEHWLEELRGVALNTALPGLTKPGAQRRHRGRQVRQFIDGESAERLRNHCRSSGHTPFSTLLTLFGELLRRHSGQRDMVIGTAVGNRPPGFERTIGMFVNTIPLRVSPPAGADGVTAVDEVTDTLLRALPHQHVPVQELTRVLGLHTSGADNPLFNVMFSAHDAPLPQLDIPGLDVSLFEGFNTGTTRFDLDVVLLPDARRVVGARNGPAGMTLIWDYDADLFPGAAIDLLMDRYLDLLGAYLARPTGALHSLAIPSAPAPLAAPRETDALDPLTAHDPASPALITSDGTLTHGELDQRVSALVTRLHDAGVTGGQPVAAVLPRGVDSIVALLACLRSGAVYAPLSPRDPAHRLGSLLDRLSPALVLATRESSLALPADRTAALLDGPRFPAAAPAEPLKDAAYLIHTSGSTGVPKAVVVGRPALHSYVDTITRRYRLNSRDKVLLFAQPSFDVALEEVLPALAAGAALVVPQREIPTGPELVAVLALRGVTVANLPTNYFLAAREPLREALRDGRWSPRLIVLGGERLPARILSGILDDTEAAVLNAYGVTEATITSTVHDITERDLAAEGDIPLGTELPGVQVHVLDDALMPLPVGAVGQLAIAGETLADGYLGAADTTGARFVRPAVLDGQRVYLTGDRGYRDLDGRLFFLGRQDNQVKLRGHRIELEEIEAAAAAVLDGRPCSVILDPGGEHGPRLIGFVQSTRQPDHNELTAALTRTLPSALLPSKWFALTEIPVGNAGKPDRAALAVVVAERESTETRQAHSAADFSDPGQALLARAWQEVLGHRRFSADSHFFEVGGHSLLAAQLAARLELHLDSRPPLRTFFQHPVLADQARVLDLAPAARAGQP
ncbi:amino acid adenylation domain-containing protein [Streptomyces phaeolivaceus]|uniref:Amino acid adenylation domain-containing protein n=1 Tax=Streptomyces phaeolivaceus TaxID=2653200 RepID=A0A5P8KCW5_9ACTN|nr:non-ribosomal peptide synthetase [Streptomyces phaeolivaceus]QFR00458.1 amino acid adenylation domain-containing protein [Streptomyces phaeolivaceus]